MINYYYYYANSTSPAFAFTASRLKYNPELKKKIRFTLQNISIDFQKLICYTGSGNPATMASRGPLRVSIGYPRGLFCCVPFRRRFCG